MSTRTRQIYEPLPHTSEYLRILTLHAGSVSDPIRCSLRTASFHEKPSYDALSYTWGDPNDTKPIEVDGVQIQVTSNLEQALCHLREGEEDLAMWVDAVCINQSDTTEKSHQVAVMGKIYTDCGTEYFNHWGRCVDALIQLPLEVNSTLRVFCSVAINLRDDRKRHDTSYFEYRSLLYQHRVYGFRECEDPRDKVYGLLGIVGSPIFTPDYTLSIDEVFFQTIYRILSQGEIPLNALIGRQYGPAPRKWAAWVPDFDAPSDRTESDHDMIRFRLANSDIYSASESKKSDLVVLMAQTHRGDGTPYQVGLETVGRRVGIVTFVSQDQCLRGIRRKDVLRQWVLEALDWDVLHEPAYGNNPIDTSEYPNIVVRFWRTLLGGLGFTSQIEPWFKSEATAISSLSGFLACLRGNIDESYLYVNDALSVSIRDRCYFKAGKDSHGLCFPRTYVGDEVWVLDGGSVPFILRPTDLDHDVKEALRPLDEEAFISHGRYEFREDRQSDKVPEGYYQFIGDCYFDGFMNGEAVRDSSFQEQTIVLL